MKTIIHTLFFLLLVTQICFAQGSWTKVGDMPEIRYAHTVDELNGKIYVVGGLNTETSSNPRTALVYDRSSGEWTQIPLCNNKIRWAHTSCIVDGKLYVIGGNDSSRTLSSMDMFDPNTGEWVSKNAMPTDRGLLACASIDGKIYVMGGLRGLTSNLDYGGLSTVEVYNTTNDTWTQLADMPTKRWGHSAVALNGKIYVFGGRSVSTPYTSVEMYDPQTNTWTTKSNMPTARYCLTTCLFYDNIFAIGGWYNSGSGPIYNKVEVYNPANDEWKTESPLPVTRAVLASIVLDGKIYVYGGSRTNHPLIGTSAIYELSFDDIFAQQPYVDKPYARKNIDSILFRTKFSNLYNHQFTPYLIYANSDNTQMDSLSLFDDGLHGDSLTNDGLYGVYIPPRLTEDFFILSVSTIDNQTNKYYNASDRWRFTTAGPLTLDSVGVLNLRFNYSLTPYVRNNGSSFTVRGASVTLRCNDPWVTNITSATVGLPDLPPGATKGSTSSTVIVAYDAAANPTYFNLKAEISVDGWTYWTDSTKRTLTGIGKEKALPERYALEQNYPNPFNPATAISFSLPRKSFVSLKVFDALGREVAILLADELSAGTYSRQWNAAGLASGVYFCQLQAGLFSETRKLILLR